MYKAKNAIMTGILLLGAAASFATGNYDRYVIGKKTSYTGAKNLMTAASIEAGLVNVIRNGDRLDLVAKPAYFYNLISGTPQTQPDLEKLAEKADVNADGIVSDQESLNILGSTAESHVK